MIFTKTYFEENLLKDASSKHLFNRPKANTFVQKVGNLEHYQLFPEAYLEPSRTSTIELF